MTLRRYNDDITGTADATETLADGSIRACDQAAGP